jgi:ornithine--oxo-acid transaminase
MVSLQVLVDEKMAENATTMGEHFRNELKALDHAHIAIVRGKGLFNAIVIDHPDKYRAWNICLAMMENGLLAKPTHHDRIRFAPPLLITREQVDECVGIIKKSLEQF